MPSRRSSTACSRRPHYGERWGRIWLDVARYGEDDYRSLNPNPQGYRPYPNAWAYRDWVIQAFNDDLPYDQFVKAQLAGDLMDPKIALQDAARHRISRSRALVLRQRLQRSHPRRRTSRPCGCRHARLPRTDGRLRPLPRSQVRSDSADRLLLAGRCFLQHDLRRVSARAEESRRRVHQDRRRSRREAEDPAGDESETSANELSRSLAFQTSNYLHGRLGSHRQARRKKWRRWWNARKLDYELLERWIKYMGKPTDKYKNKDAWQAMIKKGGGTQPEAKKLADKFQEEVVDVRCSRRTRSTTKTGSSPTRTRRHQAQEAHRQAQQLRFEQGFQSRRSCCA